MLLVSNPASKLKSPKLQPQPSNNTGPIILGVDFSIAFIIKLLVRYFVSQKDI
jgi:hypothetical protein